MARLSGFLLGALLVIGLLSQLDTAAWMDAPAPRDDTVHPVAATEVPSVAAVNSPVESPVQSPVELPVELPMAGFADGSTDTAAEPPASEPLANTGGVPGPVVTSSEVAAFLEEDMPASPSAAEAVPVSAPLPDQELAVGQQWQPVWQAFAARRSAEGFSQRLASLTGLEYRVEKLAAGRYQVEVGFTDEPDRVQALSRIEQATGLALARSSNDSP